MFEFNQQQIINAPLEKVFSFFQQPANLSKTTPEWLNFEIITKPPLIMQEGALFKYKIKLFGIPFYWETYISKYLPNKLFVDEQTKGPYKKWLHTHTFTESNGKVIMNDNVKYDLYGGVFKILLNKLFIQKSIKNIFKFRQEIFEREFL